MPSTPSKFALRGALYDIRDNIAFAREFVAGLGPDQFRADRKTVYAAVRALEIISEASRRLPDAVRERHPHIPWRAVRDVGNLYRHEYDNVAESFVWATIHDHLGPLLEVVSAEIDVLDAP